MGKLIQSKSAKYIRKTKERHERSDLTKFVQELGVKQGRIMHNVKLFACEVDKPFSEKLDLAYEIVELNKPKEKK